MGLKIGKRIFCDILDSDRLKKQTEAAEKIIISGKNNGAAEIDILMDNMDGVNVNIPNDVNVSVEMGVHEKMKIHVKYK